MLFKITLRFVSSLLKLNTLQPIHNVHTSILQDPLLGQSREGETAIAFLPLQLLLILTGLIHIKHDKLLCCRRIELAIAFSG
jgi:hypothetical protein